MSVGLLLTVKVYSFKIKYQEKSKEKLSPVSLLLLHIQCLCRIGKLRVIPLARTRDLSLAYAVSSVNE